MKILHSVAITPHRCGMYETVRELAAVERELGHDARLTDPTHRPDSPVARLLTEDRGVPIDRTEEFCQECDVIVASSKPNTAMVQSRKPIVSILHGRPRDYFLIDSVGRVPGHHMYLHLDRARRLPAFRAWVTLWREHVPYWELILRQTCHYAPPPVDLRTFNPDGERHDFGGKGGEINVVIIDPWREDIDPFDAINAFGLFCKTHPGAKLHLYGWSKQIHRLPVLLETIRETGCLGEFVGWVDYLPAVFRTADMLITSHRIAVRAIREALASGCPVVAGEPCEFTPYCAPPTIIELFAFEMDRCVKESRRIEARATAEEHFDPIRSATALLKILEEEVN